MIPYQNYRNITALIDADQQREVTYEELGSVIDQVKVIYGSSKSLIFCLMRNSIEAIAAYLGGLDGGHAICLLDAQMSAESLAELIKIYRPQWVVEALATTSQPSSLHLFEGYVAVPVQLPGLRFWSDQVGPAPVLHPDLALLLTTSGTTGSSKLVRLTKQNIQSNVMSICYYLAVNPSQRAIASLPIHYSYGLSVLNTHLSAGGSVVLTQSSVMQKEFWEVFNRYHCTSFAGVPYTYQLLHRLNMRSLSIPSLEIMTQAGGRLEKPLVAAFWSYMAERSGKFVVMYGQTEATARISYVPPEILSDKLGSIGRSIPGGKLRVCSGDEVIMQPNKVGELVYEGPNVMMGYAEKAEDLALGDVLRGVLHTEDLGYFDGDGLFYVSGRLKRISKIYGLRVNLDEIEATLSASVPVAVTGDDSVIAIFCAPHHSQEIEKRLSGLTETYQLHPLAFKCYEVAEFPRTSAGKYDYNRLKELVDVPL